jgi:sugar phosphate isomerase/epimerase
VETTRGAGVGLVYENHGKPGAWQYADFSQPPDIFMEIFRRTEGLGLGLNFDTANATAFSRDPVALLDGVIDRVETVHAADTKVRGELQGCVIGQGLVPFVPLFARLHEAQWDGWICIEEASGEGREGVQAAVEFVRRTWQETAHPSEGGK